MEMLETIKQLDNQENAVRRQLIERQLTEWGVSYVRQEYASGINLLVDLGKPGVKTGISSHFDKVEQSAGANDNGSALAVCLATIRRHRDLRSAAGIRVFFFDEEETGLKGSRAYVEKYGVAELRGLLNMELVGMGNQLALWPVDASASGLLIGAFEQAAHRRQVAVSRFDRIVTNTADHLPFREAGLADAFTITCISSQDIAVAQQYYQALAAGASRPALGELLAQAPLFRHYHQPTDTHEKLSEEALLLTTDLIWDTLHAV